MTTVDHQKQVVNLLRFFRNKLNSRIKDIDGQFDDATGMLLEQMYTKDELRNVVTGLKTMIKNNCIDELGQFTGQMVMFLKHLYLQAEGLSQTLLVETKTLDDGALLNKIGEIDLDAKIVGSGEGCSPADAAVMMKINNAKEQLERVGQRTGKLNTQLEKTKAENNRLEMECKQLQAQIAASKSDVGGPLQGDIDALRAELRKVQEKNAAAVNTVRVELFPLKDELSTKVVECTQYKQLKKMIEDKNKIIRDCQQQIADGKK